MRFKCGLTIDEQVEISKKYQEKRDAVHALSSEWKRKFTWSPIDIGDKDCRWLEYVETRKVYVKSFFRSNLTGREITPYSDKGDWIWGGYNPREYRSLK